MKTIFQRLFFLLTLSVSLSRAAAQGTTAFTYQGQLHDSGTNANGAYGMIFKLYDAATGGNQIGSGITNSVTLANGLFSANLDFGSSAFTGAARWLDITITNGGGQTLSPRVQLLPTPYALYSAVAASVSGSNVVGTVNTAVNLTNGSWITSVGSFQPPSGPIINNGLLFKNAGAVQMAIFPGGDGGVMGNWSVNGSLDVGSQVGFNGGGSFSGDGAGNVVLSGNLINGLPRMQSFAENGTFVTPPGTTRIMVEIWGAGGSGGGNGGYIYYGVTYWICGGGGGAGQYKIQVLDVTPGASYPITVGIGGGTRTTAFGGLISANGGFDGGAGWVSVVNSSIIQNFGNGGGGGSGGSNGIFPGGSGQMGGVYGGGNGGSSPRGGMGGWQGSPGSFPGGGGGGASGYPGASPGIGANGLVIVYY